ncbi:MAG: hypothetical protein NC121_20530 [Blautia sp.]|nr:hypothetical protein [Blautia sp.]
MRKWYLTVVAVGLIIILLSMPLGEWYGNIYLRLSEGMYVEQIIMLKKAAITSFQIIGGIISLLSGVGYFFKQD